MKLPPLDQLLVDARKRWQDSSAASRLPDAPPGFATRVVAHALEQPSHEMILWSRLSTAGLCLAMAMVAAAHFRNVQPRPHSAVGVHESNPVIEWIQTRP